MDNAWITVVLPVLGLLLGTFLLWFFRRAIQVLSRLLELANTESKPNINGNKDLTFKDVSLEISQKLDTVIGSQREIVSTQHQIINTNKELVAGQRETKDTLAEFNRVGEERWVEAALFISDQRAAGKAEGVIEGLQTAEDEASRHTESHPNE